VIIENEQSKLTPACDEAGNPVAAPA
jgi:hypothetical protein